MTPAEDAPVSIDCHQRLLRLGQQTQNKGGRMSSKEKTLCELKKDYLKENLKEYKKLVCDARFVCKKCGRAAKDAERLCKPVSLES
jgi:hypothetical protein